MLRKFLAALPIAALLLITPGAAFAADGNYPPPPPPQELSLAGSTAGSTCNGGAPYLTFDVKLTDPGNQSTGHTAYLVFEQGGLSHTVTLGDIDPATNEVSGSMLWPGATVDNGVPTGWPGWDQINGQWVYTGDHFGWTRSITSATIEVNPSIVVPVAYPEESASCASPDGKSAPASASQTSGLASTGVSPLLVPIGIGAGVIVLLGLAVFLFMRRRTAR